MPELASQSRNADLVAKLLAEVRQEVRDERKRKSILRREAIRTMRKDLTDLAAAGEKEIRADARPRLAAHIKCINLGFDEFERASAAHATAAPASRKYNDQAYAFASLVAAKANVVRERCDRLGTVPLAAAIRNECSVGELLSADQPYDVWEKGSRQLAALRKPEYVAVFEARGVDAALHAAELEPLVANLKGEIDKGVGPGPRKGDATEDINEALLFLEFILARTVTLLEDYDARDAAEVLKKRIPRKHFRRSTDKPEGNGNGEGKGGGGGGGGGAAGGEGTAAEQK